MAREALLVRQHSTSVPHSRNLPSPSAWASTTHPQREQLISVRSFTTNRTTTALRLACSHASSPVSTSSAFSARPSSVQELWTCGVTTRWCCAVSRFFREVTTCLQGTQCSGWRRETKCGWTPAKGPPV